MSNSTGTVSTNFVNTIAETFLTWFHSDILPVCAAVFDILVIIIGIVLNVLLLVTFRKRGLFVEPSSHFILMMCVIDFIAYVLLLIPTIITSLAKKWLLSDPVCEIHGAMLFFLVFSNFAFAATLSIERMIKLCHTDGEQYEKIFENKKVRSVIISVIWGVAVVIAFLPTTGIGNIRFDFYHQGCMLDYTDGPGFLIVHFLLTCVIPTIVVIVGYSLIFHTRKQALVENRLKNFQAVNGDKAKNRHTTTTSVGESALPTICESNEEVFSEKNGTVKLTTPNQAFGEKQVPPKPDKSRKGRPKSSPRQSMLFEVFSDDEENPAFHLALTYLYVWAITLICCFPYFVVCLYGTFNNNPLWGGFYTIAVLVIHVSFAAKPIVYLGHNRHYQQVTKQTIPEGMRNRARSMRTSVSHFAGVVEDFVFKTNANKKLNAALATQKAVLVWKKKLKQRKGMFKLKNEPETNSTPVEPTSLTTTNNTDSASKTTDLNLTSNVSSSAHPQPGPIAPRPTVTPSDVTMQTSTSSFIEKERQRLLGLNNGGGAGSPENVSPVPGMVDDQNMKLI